MSGSLRIQYPDAWYLVMNQVKRSEVVFFEEKDYLEFINLLKEATTVWKVRIGPYCLMPTHYEQT